MKKSLIMPKKLKGFFSTSKKIEGGPLGKKFFPKKSRNAEKKLKGGTLWSRLVMYATRETFLVQFLGPTTIWRLPKIL